MRYNYLLLIFIFQIAFIRAPKPENIQIFNIDFDSNKNEPYEFTVLKNETFALQFERGRGTPCQWTHSNDTFLKNSNYSRFLNSSTWDYLSEEYEKELEKVKNSTSIIQEKPLPIAGGMEYYYELFKALNGGSQPQSLYYTYSCMDKISQNVSVNIWICDEISKDPNEKCVTKILCSEIKDGATKDICSSAQVSDSNKACVFDNETNSCNEVNIAKNNAGNNKIKYVIAMISVFAIISIIFSRILF